MIEVQRLMDAERPGAKVLMGWAQRTQKAEEMITRGRNQEAQGIKELVEAQREALLSILRLVRG